jgi:DNA polymerase III epsilon subunit family exonuclease
MFEYPGDIRFAALDLETTGTNPLRNKILEVGIVVFSRNEKEIESWSTLVNPGMEVPREVVGIHGITTEMVTDAPSFDDIYGHIVKYLKGSVPIMHNPVFDLSFLTMEGGQSLDRPSLDTVRLARKAMPGKESYKLSSLSDAGGDYTHHRALDDARACRDLFLKIMDMVDPDLYWSMDDIKQYHGKPLTSPLVRKFGSKWHSRIEKGTKLTIRYYDGSGSVTERDIIPREWIRYGKKEYIRAYCSLRNEMRIFREDMIEILEG